MALSMIIGIAVFVLVIALIFALAKTIFKLVAGILVFCLIIVAIFGLLVFVDYSTMKNADERQFVLMDDDDVVFAIKIGETKTFVQDVEFDKNTFSMIADVELFDNLPETFEFAGATLSKEEYLDLLTGNDLEGLGLNDAAAKATLFSFGLDVLMDDHKIKFMVDSYRAGTLKFQPRLWTLSVLKYMPKKLYNKLISKIPV